MTPLVWFSVEIECKTAIQRTTYLVGCNGGFDVKGNASCQAGCTHIRAHTKYYFNHCSFHDIPLFMHQAFLTGCSAGGLATIIHCDEFRSLFPMTTKVKCLSDAGFFLDA